MSGLEQEMQAIWEAAKASRDAFSGPMIVFGVDAQFLCDWNKHWSWVRFRSYLHSPLRRRHRLGLDQSMLFDRRVIWFKGRRHVIQWEAPF